MDVERECRDWFTLSANTLSLVLSNIWSGGSNDFHQIFAILLSELHFVVFFFFYSNSIFKPLNGENFVIELAFEFCFRATSDRLWLWELEEEWVLDFSKTVLVGNWSSGWVQELKFLVLTNNKDLAGGETFSNVVKGFACVSASVCWKITQCQKKLQSMNVLSEFFGILQGLILIIIKSFFQKSFMGFKVVIIEKYL